MIKHKHHIIPRYMGGSDDPSNLVVVTIEEHAALHKQLWEDLGHWQDKVAWLFLSKQITQAEAIKMSQQHPRSDDFKKKISDFNIRRAAAGNHPFQDRDKNREWKLKEVAEGRHNSQNEQSNLSRKAKAKAKVEAGTFHMLGGKIQRESMLNRLKNGTHPSQIKMTCSVCGKTMGRSNFIKYGHKE